MILWRRKSNLWLLVHRPLAFCSIYWRAMVVMFVGGSLDGLTTLWVLGKYGAGAELHPAMWLAASILGVELGVPVAALAKMGFAVFAAATFRRWCRWILVVFGVLSALGAVHNCYYNRLF